VSQLDFSFSKIESIEKVSELFYNSNGDSFAMFLNVVKEKISHKEGPSVSPSSAFIRKKYLLQKSKTQLAGILNKGSATKIKYDNTKFYGLEDDVITARLSQAEKVLGKASHYHLQDPFVTEDRWNNHLYLRLLLRPIVDVT